MILGDTNRFGDNALLGNVLGDIALFDGDAPLTGDVILFVVTIG